jgi:hypothetical protein
MRRHPARTLRSRAVRWLASVKLRLFLVCWVMFSLHFATNVVREHYPAFGLIENGSLKLDRYIGFHTDIFVHSDGHAYVGNQVAGSLPALVPLILFDPVLDALEAHSLRRLEERAAPPDASYATEYPNSRALFDLAVANGLELRFGGATVATSVFAMAPLSAAMVVWVFVLLRRGGVGSGRATALALLFGFGTPLFYRTAHLNHNVFLMATAFGSFWLLWPKPGEPEPLRPSRIYTAGFLGGWCLALDYAAVVLLPVFWGYLMAIRAPRVGVGSAFAESLRYVAGSVPPVLFLLWTQWLMYGNPFFPGQYHMPDVAYTELGWRGLAWPNLEVFLHNLFDPNYGLYVFGPLLLIGLWPARYPASELILPRRERWFVVALIAVFMGFCSANQYSLMQWNSGFRYLLPLVPFIFLQASDHLARWPRWALAAVAVPAVLHTWVLSMVRYVKVDFEVGNPAVLESWVRVASEGVQLPWLNILRLTVPDPAHPIHWWIWPYALLSLALGLCAAIWYLGERAAQSLPVSSQPAPEVDG